MVYVHPSLFFNNAYLQNVSAIGLKVANTKLCCEVPITAGAVKAGNTRILLKVGSPVN